MNLTQQDIKQLNQFEKFYSFKRTWDFERFIRMPEMIVFLCTGNQKGKTGGTAYQYVLRILGKHPVPKKNLTYFECPARADAMEHANSTSEPYISPHGFWKRKYKFKDGTEITLDSWEKGTWSLLDKPKDNKCPFCGRDIIIHKRNSRVFRFCSQTLPGENGVVEGADGGSAEVKNAVYPEFKKWLPPFLIRKDMTFRSYSMIIKDPLAGLKLVRDEVNKGMDSIVEFSSYSQSAQSTAGTQKCSVWIDEESPKDFWDEQIPRLFAEDGDIVLSLTPANKISWTFDELFERASVYFRTPKVCEALSTKRYPLKMAERTDFDLGISVLQASSYDNPTINNQVIEQLMESVDDPDVKKTRLYGVHKLASGRVFKDFDWRIHIIDRDKYFPQGIFRNWRFARMIDYHEKNPWACTWIALNPYNEAFVFDEFAPSPEKMVTEEICHVLAEKSTDYRYSMNLVDPLANKIQSNTGTTVLEDLNAHFKGFVKDDLYPGFQGGYWESWDTKSTRGRDEIRKRLKFAQQCQKPFNNKVEGEQRYYPTLWILNNCKEVAKSMKQWRYIEYADRQALVNKDSNEQTSQRFSHFCMTLEAIFKDIRFRPPMNTTFNHKTPQYFQGRRVA